MTPISKSTSIKAVRYEPATKRLTIAFHSGTTHSYEGVTEHTYNGLMKAESAGRFFHAHIRDMHESKRP